MIRYLKKMWQEARRRDRRRRRDRSSGFTMLEIMIVIAIIAALGAGVGVVVFQNFKKAQVKIAKQRVTEVMSGVTQYMIDNNTCPRGLEDLITQKYVSRQGSKDPWGKDFIVRCPGQKDPESADIISTGPDKTEGTADDIHSWE
jgi:general secretion pathway protein G